MKSNNNSVSTLQYHIVWCTKYRHPVLTGAVEVETKTILAQTCAEYGWTLKAIEVMPEHVHIFLEASPDDAPSSIARTLKSISAVHIFTAFPKLKERKFWGSGLWALMSYSDLRRRLRTIHRISSLRRMPKRITANHATESLQSTM